MGKRSRQILETGTGEKKSPSNDGEIAPRGGEKEISMVTTGLRTASPLEGK